MRKGVTGDKLSLIYYCALNKTYLTSIRNGAKLGNNLSSAVSLFHLFNEMLENGSKLIEEIL